MPHSTADEVNYAAPTDATEDTELPDAPATDAFDEDGMIRDEDPTTDTKSRSEVKLEDLFGDDDDDDDDEYSGSSQSNGQTATSPPMAPA